MQNYDIVIIDSGFNLTKELETSGVCIKKEDDEIIFTDELNDEIGHGTTIHAIINGQVQNLKFFLIKLFDSENIDTESCLLAALEYVKENINCKIINISLGISSSDNLNELHQICQDITNKGIVIVSAFDNEGCFSYPAAFDCVVGVDNKNDFKNTNEFDFVENSPINIFAKGNVQRVLMQDGKISLIGGSSVACAHISSVLANIISEEFNLKMALSYLKSKSRYVYTCHKPNNNGDTVTENIKKAVVFPFSKETHALLRFADMLSFDICGYYDVKRSGKVGRRLSAFFEEFDSEEKIKDVDEIDFTDIDTIILGHLDELNSIMKRDYRMELIDKSIKNGVNIYSFDPLESYLGLLNNSNIKYFYPKVSRDNVPHNSFGKLYKICKPVVGIFGTSSQQGKFSLQISLKKELELRGYDVGTVGTEPHSLLFDFDVIFPMGYNSTVDLENGEIVLYLNDKMNELCLNGKEIILTSSQAQSIPYYCNNLLEFPSMQYHFALGTNADAIILCVNYYDELSYIRNTIYTLMGLMDAKIIALVMYPLTYDIKKNGISSQLKRKITQEEGLLLKEFNIPVYKLGEEHHMDDLCKRIIDFF